VERSRRPAASDADTVYGTAALYDDPVLGRLVIVRSDAHDLAEKWLWTGARWLQVDPASP
jgi:hypothetical protein